MFIKRAFANIAAGQTDAALITAVSGSPIKVLGLAVVAGGTATTIVFNSKGSGAGTAISATFAMAINGVLVLPETYSRDGWFVTTTGEGLTCTTGAGATTGIQIIYGVNAI